METGREKSLRAKYWACIFSQIHCCELYEFIRPSKGGVKKVERDETVQCMSSASGIENACCFVVFVYL